MFYGKLSLTSILSVEITFLKVYLELDEKLQDISFYIYVLFVLLMACVSILIKKDSSLIENIIIVSFVLASGFRSVSVPDTEVYLNLFNNYSSNLFLNDSGGQEIGFVFYGKLIKSIVDSHVFYFSSITWINLILIRSALRNLSLNVSLGLIAYISYYGVLYNFIFLRNGVAVSIVAYAFSLIVSRRSRIKAACCLVLAPLFHVSIILSVLSSPFMKLMVRRRMVLYILILSVIIYYTGITDWLVLSVFDGLTNLMIFSKYRFYFDNFAAEQGYSFRYIFNVLVLSFVVCRAKDIEEMKPYVILNVLGLLLLSTFSLFLLVDRIADALIMFNFFVVLLFLEEKSYFGKYNAERIILYFLFILMNFIFVSRVVRFFL